MSNHNEYDVELTWPKTSRQAVYAEVIEAPTQAAAIHAAKVRARNSGWQGEPIKATARIMRRVAA